jgi:hypothetical protein
MQQGNLLPRTAPSVKNFFGLQAHKPQPLIHAPRDLAVQKLCRR